LGGTGKAEDAKSAGRRNYPEAVPNGKGRNGDGESNGYKNANAKVPKSESTCLNFRRGICSAEAQIKIDFKHLICYCESSCADVRFLETFRGENDV
jgi:hypothetical protein